MRPDRFTLGLYGLVIFLGGLNFVAVRFSNRELPPFWGASLRFGTAAVLLFLVVVAMRLALPRGNALLGTVLFGALGFGASYACAYWGLQAVPAGLASLITASVPLLSLLLAAVHRLERLSWHGLAGGLLAMGGVGVMFMEPVNSEIPLPSLLAMLGMAVCVAEAGVVAKLFPKAHPVPTNALAMSVGAAILATISVIAGESWVLPSQAATLAALGYLVVFGSFTLFVLFLFVLRRWTVSAVSYQFVLFPLVAVTVSAWLEHEPLTPGLLLGGILVLAGVYVGAFAGRRAVPKPVTQSY